MVNQMVAFTSVAALISFVGGLQELHFGTQSEHNTDEFSIVSPGYPGVMTEAGSMTCKLFSPNGDTNVTITPTIMKLFDAGIGICRERLDTVFHVVDGQRNKVYCQNNDRDLTTTTWSMVSRSEIIISIQKCDSRPGGQLHLDFTSTRYVRVNCLDTVTPSSTKCPIITTTTETTTTSTTTLTTAKEDNSITQKSQEDISGSSSDGNLLYYIIGGVIGGIVLLCIIIILIVCLLRDSKKKPTSPIMIVQKSSNGTNSNGTSEHTYDNVEFTGSRGQAALDPEKGKATYKACDKTKNDPEMYAEVDMSKKQSKRT